MSQVPFAQSSSNPTMRDERSLSQWLQAWNVARLSGVSFRGIVGYVTCDDNCALDRGRWRMVTCDQGSYYECHVCKRFVGWIRANH